MGMIDFIADRIADRIVAKRQSQSERNDRASYIELSGNRSEANIFIGESQALGENVAFACGNFDLETGRLSAGRNPRPARFRIR